MIKQDFKPKYLWLLIITYSMAMITANCFDARLVQIFSLVTDAGTLIFPITFLVSDLITEVYGYQYTRQAIWTGFAFNYLFLLYSQLVIHLPSPSYALNNHLFEQLFSLDTRIVIASTISYFCSEPFNAIFLAKLKIYWHGKLMGLRFVLSTMAAALIDSFIFSFCAFYRTMPLHDLFTLILTMWGIKVFIEILGLPLSTYCANLLKRKEQMDIYDNNTLFNLFKLRVNYQSQANHYKEA